MTYPGNKTAAFARRLKGADQAAWFRALAEAGWLCVDWPEEHGGPGWTRTEQLAFIETLADHQCPLPPLSITVIAPLLIAFGSEDQTHDMLSRILENPIAYRFQVSSEPKRRGHHPGCLTDPVTDDLFLVDDHQTLTPVGPPGCATRLLATTGSPLWLLYEQLLGARYLKEMRTDSLDTGGTGQAEWSIGLDALRALFCQGTRRTDQQVALRANRDRPLMYSRLVEALGYYALIAPDSRLTSNEPLPFTRQREYLFELRQQITRNEMIQQDLLYSKQINPEAADHEKT